MNCDWMIRRTTHRNGMLVQNYTGETCGKPVAVRYRQRDTEPWGYRCAGVHADALNRDVVTVEVLAR